MRKSDKKIDNQIRVALTEVCDIALKDFYGFQWLTHTVNYNKFPQSLKIVCVYDTNENLVSFNETTNRHQLSFLIENKLVEIGINLKNINNHISYDSEESCLNSHNGNWAARLG